MGWGVWAHHMFTTGLGPVANSAFALSTMFIAVPTGVKIFNWLGTMWGGDHPIQDADAVRARLHRDVHHRRAVRRDALDRAVTTQQQDTYYIVAHFHYVLFGGAIFGLFAGHLLLVAQVFGRMLSERLGKSTSG